MDDPTGNKMLLVMDYMEGGPVMTRDALERGRCIPEPLALQYFRDMCKVSISALLPQLAQQQLLECTAVLASSQSERDAVIPAVLLTSLLCFLCRE